MRKNMRCPVCGWKTIHVIETRYGTWRRRECRKCLSRWSTEEALIPGSVKQNPGVELFKSVWEEVK